MLTNMIRRKSNVDIWNQTEENIKGQNKSASNKTLLKTLWAKWHSKVYLPVAVLARVFLAMAKGDEKYVVTFIIRQEKKNFINFRMCWRQVDTRYQMSGV